MILASFIRQMAKDPVLMAAEVAAMHPADFILMCRETNTLPVLGKVAFLVKGKLIELRPLSHSVPVGQTFFTSRAQADAWLRS